MNSENLRQLLESLRGEVEPLNERTYPSEMPAKDQAMQKVYEKLSRGDQRKVMEAQQRARRKLKGAADAAKDGMKWGSDVAQNARDLEDMNWADLGTKGMKHQLGKLNGVGKAVDSIALGSYLIKHGALALARLNDYGDKWTQEIRAIESVLKGRQ